MYLISICNQYSGYHYQISIWLNILMFMPPLVKYDVIFFVIDKTQYVSVIHTYIHNILYIWTVEWGI